jgi:hypothetical protein
MSLHNEITTLCGSNMGAASSFVKIKSEHVFGIVAQLKKFNIKGELIWCLFKDVNHENADDFTEFVLALKERPTSCPRGMCDWKVTEEAKKEQEPPGRMRFGNICVNRECGVDGLRTCGACFSVKYCSRECQTVDRARHKKECKGVITAVTFASKYGKEYSRSVITGMINMDNSSFDKLWKLHITKSTRVTITASAKAVSDQIAISRPRQIHRRTSSTPCPPESRHPSPTRSDINE